MTYPPSLPGGGNLNSTPSRNTHPTLHNVTRDALSDILAELGSSPKGSSASLTVRLTGLSYDGARTVISAVTHDTVRAGGSSGLVIQATGGATVLTLGPGGGQSATFADGCQVTGQLQANANTESSSTTTGSAVVAGGIGVAKNARIGGALYSTGIIYANDTTDCTAANTGALQVQGGVWVEKQLRSGGDIWSYGGLFANIAASNAVAEFFAESQGTLNFTAGTNGTATAFNGAPALSAFIGTGLDISFYFVVNGGAAGYFNKNEFAIQTGKKLLVNDTTDCTAADTGALQVQGGAWVEKQLRVGEDFSQTGGKFHYLRGDASTDGSVRISSPSSGTASIEIRKSGVWTTVQTWS